MRPQTFGAPWNGGKSNDAARDVRVISRGFPWMARQCSTPEKPCQPYMPAGCGSRATGAVIGITLFAGLISGGISISDHNTPRRPRLTMSTLTTYGRCNRDSPGARISAHPRRTSASTSPGTVTSRRRTSMPYALSCAAIRCAAQWASTVGSRCSSSTPTNRSNRQTSGVSPSPPTSPSWSVQLSMRWQKQFMGVPLGATA